MVLLNSYTIIFVYMSVFFCIIQCAYYNDLIVLPGQLIGSHCMFAAHNKVGNCMLNSGLSMRSSFMDRNH